MTLLLFILAALCVGALVRRHHRRRASNQTGGSWRAIIAGVLVAAAVLLAPTAALAATAAEISTSSSSALGLDAFTVTVLMGLILPVINGLIMRPDWADQTKAALGVITAGVAAVINVSLVDGGAAIISQSTIQTAVLTWAIQIVTLYGVYKPVGVDDKLKSIGTT